MYPTIDLVQALTDPGLPVGQKREVAQTFSLQFGWRPNDFLEFPDALPAANLIVEQGLDTAAMLSFLPSDRCIADIRTDERLSILGLSYNSLIDWHIWVDQGSVQYIHNRADPLAPAVASTFGESDHSALTRRVFDEAVERAPNPNLMSLDSALLDTISTWRKILFLELGSAVTSTSMSSLFNAIILARAVEDLDARTRKVGSQMLLKDIVSNSDISIGEAIELAISERTDSRVSKRLFDHSALDPFSHMSDASKRSLVGAFYRHDAVPYEYDFSVMSKHALSKVYERYVAVMQHEESIQFSLFPSDHEEAWNKQLGGIYTPQYIASFFARYLKSQLPAEQFLESRVADPACGSGVFLRATMEQKLLATDYSLSDGAGPALNSLLGIDIEENAVAAASLSLALLYLAARGLLPDDIPIVHDDSIKRFSPTVAQREGEFDAVMANPPFVRTEAQPEGLRQAIRSHLDSIAKGKSDTYLAFLALSIRAIRPGGFGFFVVPHPLLTSDNLKKLRDWIRGEAWVHVIADLSAIRVFKADVYVALLIVQRKHDPTISGPPVALIRCQRDIGLALEDFLDGKHRRTSSYFIYEAPQEALARATWSVVTPEEGHLLARLEAMPRLNEIAVLRQGVITGADDVFILDTEDIPQGEEILYRPLMPDRSIGRFVLPEETGKRVFYPYIDGAIVTTTQLRSEFPSTWDRLNRNRDTLSSRKSIRSDSMEWWRPIWPRSPQEMFAPKVVAPEVSLLPRFGLDSSGRWVVSHSPFIRTREEEDEELLFVLTAILNSSATAWFINLNARKYRNGYNKIGVRLLRRLPIPDLSRVPNTSIQRTIDLVRKLIGPYQEFDYDLASSIDDLVLSELYFLSDDDIRVLKPREPHR